MKKICYLLGTLCIFCFLLFNPHEAMQASLDGLLLWFETLLPTLLPFLIVSNFLMKIDGIRYITFFAAPVLKKTLHISTNGAYAVFTGFLCGYPMGAKITADLVTEQKISRAEGEYLLTFCNNLSPAFLINFFILQSMKASDLMLPILLILYAAPVLTACIYRIPYHRHMVSVSGGQSVDKTESFSFRMIDDSIMNGFETITKLGGYIILFSIITKMVTVLPDTVTMSKYIFISLTEITNGIEWTANSTLSFAQKLLILLPACSFGGLSSLAQTASMIKDAKLSFFKYLTAKCITTGITLLLTLCYLHLYL